MRSKKIEHWDDERDIGNSLIVTLKRGWRFGTDPFIAEHTRGFDTAREANAAVRAAVRCNCESCS